MNYVLTLFSIIMGIMGVVLLLISVNNWVGTSCVPEELLKEDSLVGFGGKFLDDLYDNFCMNSVDINNGVWNFYETIITGVIGARPTLSSIGMNLNGLINMFCLTHSNQEYYDEGTGGNAIDDSENFKNLFVYEIERCWSIFEGRTNEPIPNRHPLGKQAIFDCGEIIFSFNEGEQVSLAELYDLLLYDNDCGKKVNAPCKYDTDENDFSESIMWCAPKTLMEEYWSDSASSYEKPTISNFEGGNYELTCTNDKQIDWLSNNEISACLPYEYAFCSLDSIESYSASTLPTDESAIISGKGKITISYFDYFNWEAFDLGIGSGSIATDKYPACDYVNIFNDFKSEDLWTYKPRKQNSILICYEKFEDDSKNTEVFESNTYLCSSFFEENNLQDDCLGYEYDGDNWFNRCNDFCEAYYYNYDEYHYDYEKLIPCELTCGAYYDYTSTIQKCKSTCGDYSEFFETLGSNGIIYDESRCELMCDTLFVSTSLGECKTDCTNLFTIKGEINEEENRDDINICENRCDIIYEEN